MPMRVANSFCRHFFADWNYQRDPAPHLPAHNTRLTHLCGPGGRTCAPSRWPGVGIAHRHEQFKADGPKAKATQAMELLQALYEIASAPSEDHLQLMLAGDSELLEAARGRHRVQHPLADLRGRTATQSLYLQNIATHDITFGIGPAGTGKTIWPWPAPWMPWERSSVQRIVLTRPAVERASAGLLPGDLVQKVDSPTCARCTTPCMN